jgi:hypothetical protein
LFIIVFCSCVASKCKYDVAVLEKLKVVMEEIENEISTIREQQKNEYVLPVI